MTCSDFSATRRRFRVWLLALSCALLLPALARAELAAHAAFVKGMVTAAASGAADRILKQGDDILSGDTIDTGDSGRIQMRFTDGGLVSLMPRSTFSVEAYQHEGLPQEEGSLIFGMVRGGMRTLTGSIGKVRHENYELRTPVATLGIRGTEYIAVLNPPNTLRVHVGKGKVVITNEQGTLEVPEGRNAVVTLGGVPAFTDEEPQFLAAAVGGDLALSTTGARVDEDPYWVTPSRDLPLAPLPEVTLLPPTTPPSPSVPPAPPAEPPVEPPVIPPVTPPVDPPVIPPVDPPVTPPTAILPDGGGYLLAGFLPGGSYYASQYPSDFAAMFDPETGAITQVLGMNDFDVGTLQVAPGSVGTEGSISWGEFTDGTGVMGGTTMTLGASDFQPYIVGQAVETLPGGTLDYHLAGATPVRGVGPMNAGDQGVLDAFNLSIDLANLSYAFDMRASMQSFGESVIYEATSPAGSSLVGDQDAFGFSAAEVFRHGTSCEDCAAQIQGFLAGPNAEQAGVGYVLDGGNGEVMTGTAGLKR